MKFFVILISLLLVMFGGLFSYITWEPQCIKELKNKLNYNSLTDEQKLKINKLIKDISTYCFLACMFGTCMFIAGLFI